MIRKVGSRYRVVSHRTGRSLGTYRSKRAARRRLAQVAYFKRRRG